MIHLYQRGCRMGKVIRYQKVINEYENEMFRIHLKYGEGSASATTLCNRIEQRLERLRHWHVKESSNQTKRKN